MAKRKSDNSTALLVVLTIVFVLLAAILVFVLLQPTDKKPVVSDTGSEIISSEVEEVSSESSLIETSSSDVSSVVSETSSQKVEVEVGEWALTLANVDNPLPSGFNVKTSVIDSEFNPYVLKFDSRAVESLNNMLRAAKADGVKIQVISAYRSLEKQTTLYNNKVSSYKSQGYSDADAKAAAAKVVAIPGTSDHNLGLAVDLDSVETTYENTPQFKWLKEHCVEYGFVLRYPKDKSEITGIIYEPWHYRFVGVEAAREMQEKNMCLEEYTEYLKKK